MKDWNKIVINKEYKIIEAMQILQDHYRLAVVVDENYSLVGTLTDGDVRRGLLNGLSVENKVSSIMRKNPHYLNSNSSKEEIKEYLKSVPEDVTFLPVLEPDNKVVDLVSREEFLKEKEKNNPIVIMAGGLGSRLGKLTKERPKPLLSVGGRPILETILERFISEGFNDFHFSVNYKSEMIQKYFKDGSDWDVSINYIQEEKPLGTAGCLGLTSLHKQENPVIVMNGDLLTKLHFNSLLNFHTEHKSELTMCVTKYNFQVPYGVINVEDFKITSIDEKPNYNFFVNAGIYVISPNVLNLIPRGEYFDMTMLFDNALKNGKDIGAFPLHEYWQDIGQIEDFNKAKGEYSKVFE